MIPRPKRRNSSLIGTQFLLLLNLAFFALEINYGGSKNLDTLYRLGALVSDDVWRGEWWRLLTANFLHYGTLHLAANMIALWSLGSMVELYVGTGLYLVSYLFCGVGAMLGYSIINSFYLTQKTDILVGASGAIMGLLGIIATIYAKQLLRVKSFIALRQLAMIILIIGLQFAFDIANPQISFLTHLLGLIIGLIWGTLII